jgi:uncharacterized protein YndB with AHSA1/START domain
MHEPSTDQQSVVLERVIDAPIELVWEMWTDPAKFSAWYGPAGATVPVAEFDVSIGGRRRICMAMGPRKMWFAGEYLEVTKPTRLVYTEVLADEQGNAVSPESLGMPAGTPGTTEVAVLLEDIDGSTRIELRHSCVAADSGAAQGWDAALTKLAAELQATADV